MPSSAPSPQAARGADDMDLTELEIIRRYSLAVRQGSASRAEVVATLRSDLARLERPAATPRTGAAPRPAPKAPARKRRAPAERTAPG